MRKRINKYGLLCHYFEIFTIFLRIVHFYSHLTNEEPLKINNNPGDKNNFQSFIYHV
jgi:hypothetical protein